MNSIAMSSSPAARWATAHAEAMARMAVAPIYRSTDNQCYVIRNNQANERDNAMSEKLDAERLAFGIIEHTARRDASHKCDEQCAEDILDWALYAAATAPRVTVTGEVWCRHCERPAVAEVRLTTGEWAAYCAEHITRLTIQKPLKFEKEIGS